MRGKKCPMRHTRVVGPSVDLPFVSAHQNADGECELHVRPPLKDGLDMYFSDRHGEKRGASGDDDELTTASS